METNVLLIPSPLGDENDPINDLYDEVAERFKIDAFFIESRKKPISVINQIYPDRDREIDIYVLDKNTPLREIDRYITEIKGMTVGIITDAGIPGISDPGTVFIRKAHQNNYEVMPLISASSVTAAIASSGLRGERFEYHGYIEREKEKRVEQIRILEERSFETFKTQIFIETPYRNIHLWKDILNFCSPETDFSISVDLFTKNQFIKPASVENWKRMRWPTLDDHQAVFLINARPILN